MSNVYLRALVHMLLAYIISLLITGVFITILNLGISDIVIIVAIFGGFTFVPMYIAGYFITKKLLQTRWKQWFLYFPACILLFFVTGWVLSLVLSIMNTGPFIFRDIFDFVGFVAFFAGPATLFNFWFFRVLHLNQWIFEPKD